MNNSSCSCQDIQSPNSLSDCEETCNQSPGRKFEHSTHEQAYTPATLLPVLFLPTSIVFYNSSMNNSPYYLEELGACSSDFTDSSLTPSQECDTQEELLKDDIEVTSADISSRPWDWAQSPEFIPKLVGDAEPGAEVSDTTEIEGMVCLSKDATGELITNPTQGPRQPLLYPVWQTRVPISYADAAKSYTMGSWGCPTYEPQDMQERYEQCDMCMEVCLDRLDVDQQKAHRRECTANIEQEMEEAFAYQRSEGKVCGICYEEVITKQTYSERRFGILLGCLHVFCLSCIRKWRTNSGGDKNAVRSCPLCRTHSDYVIPSAYWVDETEDKSKLIDQYQKKLSHIACRYFDEGNGTCPFGNNCFYRHALPNGDIHREKIRKYGNADGEVRIVQPVCLNQFIQERENRAFS